MVCRATVFALVGAMAASCAGAFDISMVGSDVVSRFREAWHISERGDSNREVVVQIVRQPDGAYAAEIATDPQGYQTVTFEVRPEAVAIFHTHPNRCPAKPSPQDTRNSDQLQVPNFTLTNRGMWVYDPASKRTSLVMPFLSWLRPENWQRARVRAATAR